LGDHRLPDIAFAVFILVRRNHLTGANKTRRDDDEGMSALPEHHSDLCDEMCALHGRPQSGLAVEATGENTEARGIKPHAPPIAGASMKRQSVVNVIGMFRNRLIALIV
jgi:hypothetical protein